MTTQDTPVTTRLAALHEVYVDAVNYAVEQGRMDLVETLAAEFDREAHVLELQAA